MIPDNRGDFGFTESIVSFMVVTTVLGLYLVSLAYALPVMEDPLADLELSEFKVDLRSDEPVSFDYLNEFMSANGLSGIRVDLETFGVIDSREIHIGSVTSNVFCTSDLVLAEFDHGRTLPVKVVVTAYV